MWIKGKLFLVVFILTLTLTIVGNITPVNSDTGLGPVAVLETPVPLMDQSITSFDAVPFKVFWLHAGYCAGPPPTGTATPAHDEDRVIIGRVATYGGSIRELFNRHEAHDPDCNPYEARSNIVSDGDYVYWADSEGLVRLSHEANVGDEPELISAAIRSEGGRPVLLAEGGDSIFTATYESNFFRLRKVFKASGISIFIGSAADVRKLTYDGKYLYWLDSDELWRANQTQGIDFSVVKIGDDVTAFFPEGPRQCPPTCQEQVFIARNNHRVMLYNNSTGSIIGPIYQGSAEDEILMIYDLAADEGHLFIRLLRYCPGPGLCQDNYTDILLRTTRSIGGEVDPIDLEEGIPLAEGGQLVNGRITRTIEIIGDNLFYQREGRLYRLPKDADALPQIDLRIDGMLITQGLQSIDHDVMLIRGKRTFVRVLGQAEGGHVEGVTAHLNRRDPATGQITGETLLPINGTHRTIYTTPIPQGADNSFLFELPMSWVDDDDLWLRAFINPGNVPLEKAADRFNNDFSLTDPILPLIDSPRLEMDFYLISFTGADGVTYAPYADYYQRVINHVRHLYPLASSSGGGADPSPGLRPNVKTVHLPHLADRVDLSDPVCITYSIIKDCAASYVNSWLQAQKWLTGSDHLYFGAFSSATAPEGLSPRGLGIVGEGVAGAPATTATLAAHEIGHALGRKHPAQGAGDNQCGHSPGDFLYPYPDSRAGDHNSEGFFWGEPLIGQTREVFTLLHRYDLMGYCKPGWISDYTYEHLWGAMTLPFRVSQSPFAGTDGVQLLVNGAIHPEAETAELHFVQVLEEAIDPPPQEPGDYVLSLLNSAGQTLAAHLFSPATEEDGEASLPFGLVVPLPAGTSRFQITGNGSPKVLAERAISSQPPTVQNVAVVGAGGELAGPVTLAWTGSDADGDDLTYDVYYSRNGGVTYDPVHIGLTEEETVIDTADLGGGQLTRFRVVASDGALTGIGVSPFYRTALKPPAPVILAPADGHVAQWGQLVQFFGEAFDLQDGYVGDSELTWTVNGRRLGVGSTLAKSDLPVGTNEIRLSARNSHGMTAGTTITVIIHDDLAYPGPTLSVGPESIGWHVANGTTADQTAELLISNSGTGSFTWSVSDDVPWLAVYGPQGIPAMLTVVADPRDLPADSTATATITVTAELPNGNQQVVEIPVSLSVGFVWGGGEPSHQATLFLPVITNSGG